MKNIAIMSLLALSSGSFAFATQLAANGTFETGLAGWTSTNETGSTPGGGFIATSATTLPQSGSTTVGAKSGTLYAVSDSGGPGAHALTESFTVPVGSTVILSFDMFVNSGSPAFVNAAGLDFNVLAANQHARVDILTSGASTFDTGVGVLRNFYLGVDSGTNPNPYTSYSFDITSLVGAGGAFQLRFAEVDNLDVLNMGIDNVSINATPAVTGVPEPFSLGLMAMGLGGIGMLRRRRAIRLRD